MRRELERLRRDGRRSSSGPVRLVSLHDEAIDPPRLVFAIPRAVGTAVVRNRVRRRLRHAAGEVGLGPGLHQLRIAPAAAHMDFDALRHHLEQAYDALR